MPPRIQKLIFIVISVIFLMISLIVILFNIEDNIVFFFTPSEIIENKILNDENIRIGGLVKINSIIYNEDKSIDFIITDNKNDISVNYYGIIPDLFKEGSGVVAEGELLRKKLIANKILAKHDENYMPEGIKKQLIETDNWQKNYK